MQLSHFQSSPVPPSLPVACAFRAPRRITITIPYSLYAYLQAGSVQQGRSLSNFAAHLLESGVMQQAGPGYFQP